MVGPLSYFSFQPVLHDWCNKDSGMCYRVCGVVHIKYPLLLIRKSSPCSGGSRFPHSLYEWSFIISLMSYNCIKNVLSVSLNKTFPSFLTLSHILLNIQGYWSNFCHILFPKKYFQIINKYQTKNVVHLGCVTVIWL